MKTELEKMLSGEISRAGDPEIHEIRIRGQRWLSKFNQSEFTADTERRELCEQLFGHFGKGSIVCSPFTCELGQFIEIGEKCYINFNVTILDLHRVSIEDHVMIAPNVHIYTATHSLDHSKRLDWEVIAKPVTLKRHAWIGGGAVICPGVTIGERSVVGAGAVVTRDVPDDCVVAGNPARVIRKLNQHELQASL
ncbi:sugar O-acetyltransferase [Dongshaea marina]|uniref:sugar O-acetyltransferase n=1 Tax=Dongshaea marina TaxID=2047966 RepID=UPI000D3EC6D4|nr:sugar O-acetyltransferase [Dongshaea marina]